MPFSRRRVAVHPAITVVGTLEGMRLRAARLCLDCEEVHDRQACPVCGSESFAYLSKWIPESEERGRPQPAPHDANEHAELYRKLLTEGPAVRRSSLGRWLTSGAVGVAVLSAAGWFWRRR
jgi:hypothetical protein